MKNQKSPERLRFEQLLSWCHEEHAAKGEVPVVLGKTLYEHMGNPVSVREATQYQVQLEGTFGDLATIHRSELELRPMR